MHFIFSVLIVLIIVQLSDAFHIGRVVATDSLLRRAQAKNPFAVDVEFVQTHKTVKAEAEVGEKISAVARRSGVEIQYKCGKGECGTCQVRMDGKWVKTCIGTPIISPVTNPVLRIQVPEKGEKARPAKFFTPASFVEGIINNGVGVIGFVKESLKADDAFEKRMERERKLAAKVAERKKSKSE
eukprot:gene7385-8168_t